MSIEIILVFAPFRLLPTASIDFYRRIFYFYTNRQQSCKGLKMQQVRLSSPIFRQPSILLKSTRLHLVQAPPHAWAYNTPHGPNIQASHTQNADQRPPIPSS